MLACEFCYGAVETALIFLHACLWGTSTEGTLCTLPGIPYHVPFSGILYLAMSAGALSRSLCCLVTALDGPKNPLVQSAFFMIRGELPLLAGVPSTHEDLGSTFLLHQDIHTALHTRPPLNPFPSRPLCALVTWFSPYRCGLRASCPWLWALTASPQV